MIAVLPFGQEKVGPIAVQIGTVASVPAILISSQVEKYSSIEDSIECALTFHSKKAVDDPVRDLQRLKDAFFKEPSE